MRILDPDSLDAYRYRVRMLSREVCEQIDPQVRVNIAQQLASAAADLALLEAQELKRLTTNESA
jgi:hypothetical protein